MSNAQDTMHLLFPAQRPQVLAALLLQPGHSLHLRELARLTGSLAGTLGRELGKLAQVGLLLRSDQGNQARYSANVQHPLFPELSAMFRKTHGAGTTPCVLRNMAESSGNSGCCTLAL